MYRAGNHTRKSGEISFEEERMELKSNNSKPTTEPGSNSLDDRIVPLFEPDILSSTQFLANYRRKAILQPEKSLMLAILDDAVHCFKDHVAAQSGRGKRLFDEAAEWFLAWDDDGLFSFENICDVLGMNAAYLRQGLFRWRKNKIANDIGRLYRYDRRNRLRLATSR